MQKLTGRTSIPPAEQTQTQTQTQTSSQVPQQNVATTEPSCPVGVLYGEIVAVVATPTAVGSESYVNLSINGYVVNDADESVVLTSVPPKIVLYSKNGEARSYVYPSWAVPEAAAGNSSALTVEPGSVARWELTNYLMPTTQWSGVGSVSASPVAPFSARWSSNDQVRACVGPLQPSSNTRRYSVTS